MLPAHVEYPGDFYPECSVMRDRGYHTYITLWQSNVCLNTFLIPSCTCYESEDGGSRLHRNVTQLHVVTALVSQIERLTVSLLFRTADPKVWDQGRVSALSLPTFRRRCPHPSSNEVLDCTERWRSMQKLACDSVAPWWCHRVISIPPTSALLRSWFKKY